jgi:Flp pilus assembly protein TadB
VNAAQSSPEASRLRARRREARRRRRLARIDLGVGLCVAIVLLLATPGLAITAIAALLLLAGCLLSFVLERRAAQRSAEKDRARAGLQGARRARH